MAVTTETKQLSWVISNPDALQLLDEESGCFLSVVRPGPGRVFDRSGPPRLGDHLSLDSRLYQLAPDAFTPSTEPPDVELVEQPTTTEQARRKREASRRQPLVVTEQSPVCRRCGWRGSPVIMPPTPNWTDFQTIGLDDPDQRTTVLEHGKQLVTERLSAERLWTEATAAARDHVCPEGSPADDEVAPLPVVQSEADRVHVAGTEAYELQRGYEQPVTSKKR